MVNLSFCSMDDFLFICHFYSLPPSIFTNFCLLSEMLLYVGFDMAFQGFVSGLAILQLISACILWNRLILAVFVCAVSHRTFSQNLKYVSAWIPRFQENGSLPSGVYLYIGITSCDYKISQLFSYFNMEYWLNRQIYPCAKYRFAPQKDVPVLTTVQQLWYAVCVGRPLGRPFSFRSA